MCGLVDGSTLKGEGAILPKKKDKSVRHKEFDNYKESNTTDIVPLVDCNYQPKLIDGDG